MKQLIHLILLYNLCLFTALYCGRLTINEKLEIESVEKFLFVLAIMMLLFYIVVFVSTKKL